MTDRDQYWYKRTKMYAYSLYLMFVDRYPDPEEIFNMLVKDGFVDADQEWIEDD